MDNFTNHVFKAAVASLCQAIGWNSAQTSTVDVLADLWRRQFLQLAKGSTNYATHYGRTEVAFDDTALAFSNLNVQFGEIEEYTSNFDPVLLPFRVPNVPLPKESNLNFLRPGSEEVLTRPVHVHEYMPTWNPQTREDIKKAQEGAVKSVSDTEGDVSTSSRVTTDKSVKSDSPTKASKSPMKSKLVNGDRDSSHVEGTKSGEDKSTIGGKGDESAAGAQGAPESPSSPPLTSTIPSKPGKRFESENPALKRVRLMLEEEGHTVRQATSAMMTTSGFLTSSVEGKLPESRRPPNYERFFDFFEPAPVEKKKKIPTMKRIIEGIKKIDKEKENQAVKGDEDENVYEDRQDNLFSNPDRIQKFVKVAKDKEDEKAKLMKKASRAFKLLEKSYKEQKVAKRKESKAEKRKRKEREDSESEVESIEGAFSDMDKTPEEMNVEEEEPPTKKIKRAKIPKLTIEKSKDKKEKKKSKVKEEPAYEEVVSEIPIPAAPEGQPPLIKRRGGKKKPEFSEMPSSLFSTQLVSGDDDYTKVRRRSKRNSIDQCDMDMLVPEISINVSKQSRPPQPPQDLNFPMGRIPMQPGLIPATFNTQSLMQQQNQFSIVPSISITPSTPDISLTPLTSHDLTTPSSSLGLSSNIGSSITITRISMADKSMPQPAAQPTTSTLTSPLSISITKESHPKNVSPNVSYQQPSNTGITITPIKMKHSIPDFSLTEGELSREHQRSGSEQLDEDFRSKEQRRKEREKRKELKKERKKEKKLKEKEKGKVEKIKLSSDGGSGFSVERKEKKDKDKKKNRDSLSGLPGRAEGTIPKLTLKIHSNTSTPVDSPRGMDRETPPPARKFTIKSTEESIRRRTPSPELARFSPLVTRQPKLPKIPKVQSTPKPLQLQPSEVVSFPPPGAGSAKKSKKTPRSKGKSSQSGLVTETVGIYIDEEGNKIWICPACGRQDDGTPMIGCDTCDDWYHFTCVGINETPDETESWFCGKCSLKRVRPSDQKRKVLKI